MDVDTAKGAAGAAGRDEYAKLSLGERIGYGLGDFAQNLVFGTVGGFLLLYLTTVNGIASATGAFIFTFVRVFNVFWDPWVGTFVDKHIFKTGKYKPYLLYAGIPLVVFAAMLFYPNPAVRGSVPFAFLSYLATAMIYSFVNIPYGSLNASMTRDPGEVDKLTTTRMMLANGANLLVYTLFPMFVQMAAPSDRSLKDTGLFGLKLNLGNYTASDAGDAWFNVYAVYMVLGFVALMASYFTVKERVVATAEQTSEVKYSDLFAELKNNRPLRILGLFFLVAFTFMFFGNTVFGFFAQYNVNHSEWMGAIGLVASVPGIVFPVFWPRLRNIFGKKGFFYFFLGMFIVGTLLLWVWSWPSMHDRLWLGYIARFIHQWGLSSATGFMWALVPEVVSYGELRSGKRESGVVNAIMGLFFKLGMAVGGAIPGFINGWFGFDGDAKTQSAKALLGINLSMVWFPVVLALLAMYIMSKYPLSEADVDDINRQLDAKRA
ncbi:MAG: MFS transporter [Acidobacteriota bacterium]|jgi:GPH family glycoside/pentoside/hexuronide:cation symporter|nr:MFS transporter [Acidobacteriota bacterium]